MAEAINGTNVRTGFVLEHGQSFSFSRHRAMVEAGEAEAGLG
jgi:hypothetical protein